MIWSMEGVHESSAAPADVFRYYVDPATWGQLGSQHGLGSRIGAARARIDGAGKGAELALA